LSQIGEKYTLNPINDLRPVCPNCHAIIHKKNPPFTIDEVKKFISGLGVTE
jgi:5-methylcytosine-specific restriction protein A